MAQLRDSVINDVLDRLEGTRFGLGAYKVDFPDKGTTLFKITFLPDEKYFLELSSDRASIWLRMSPAEFKTSGAVSFDAIDDAVGYIGAWAATVGEELMARARKRVSIDEIVESIDLYINEKVSAADSGFEHQEIETLKARLSSLEERFKEFLDRDEITRQEYQSVKAAIDTASNDVSIYSKKVWYKTAMTKVLSTVKSIVVSKEGRELMLSAAKKTLSLD